MSAAEHSALVDECLIALTAEPETMAWRNPTLGTAIEGRFIRAGRPGAADILCCRRGRAVAVECKTGDGRQRKTQRQWQAAFERAGGVYVLARAVDDMWAGLAAAGLLP